MSHNASIIWRAFTAGLCACGLMLSACGGSDDGNDAPTTAPATVTPRASVTPAASPTALPPTPAPQPPSAEDAAAIEALMRQSFDDYNASNWAGVIGLYSACLKGFVGQGEELYAGLQKERSESGAATVTSITGLVVSGDYASAVVTVERERAVPPTTTETLYFEREEGTWKLSASPCQNLPTPVAGG